MRQYIKVSESRDHYCNACGKRYDGESLEEKKIFNIAFVQDCENGNIRSQRFGLCWNCTKDLSKKMAEARYNSV